MKLALYLYKVKKEAEIAASTHGIDRKKVSEWRNKYMSLSYRIWAFLKIDRHNWCDPPDVGNRRFPSPELTLFRKGYVQQRPCRRECFQVTFLL